MKLEVIESDSNYVATIVKLPELKPVNGLDNLMLANVFGYNCLVGKDSNPNELYVFFPAECVLSEKFLSWNNLYRKSEMNVEKFKSGFFDESGRVKAVKFKGIVSSGFLIPVKSLLIICSYTDLKVWDVFHNINWEKVCKKYRSPQSIAKDKQLARQGIKQPKYDRVIPTQFRLHVSTPQFLRFIDDFREGDRVVITEKLHWTSAVFSNILTKRPITKMERLAKFFWITINETEYFPLYSSRTVIKNKDVNPNQDWGFYWEDLWGTYAKLLEGKIEKGITLYGEIVGYTSSGKYIQSGYHYGCKEGESKFYVYRITYTTPDGNVIEFTDSQIRQYASLRDLNVVPLIKTQELYWDWKWYVDAVMYPDVEMMCPLNDNKVPREWVVIRRDWQESYSAYKLKSQLFLGYETKMIDEGKEDTEENN